MSRIVFLAALVTLSCSTVTEADVQLKGDVDVNSNGDVLLALRLTNESESAICFEDWFPNRHVKIDVAYADSFIIAESDGGAAQYISRIADLDPQSANRRIYMLKVGETAEAIVELSSLYALDEGSYSVSYLLSTMPCSIYAKAESYLTSSNNLKYLSAADELSLVSSDENIVTLEPIHFELSD